ncbi:MAG: F0F1 ATP synthase subunit delta [Gammaproteobacteria bacterium]|nr:F0F1 ATP synthase subunit delta [Gammaproteobacteria bacterium]
MSTQNVIARPYAKAVFDYALASKRLDDWTNYLATQAFVVLDPLAQSFIANPASTDAQLTEVVLAPFSSADHEYEALKRWVEILVAQGRLLALPAIYYQFRALCEEYKQLIRVTVKSFSPLSAKQQQKLIDRLTQKLKRHIELTVEVDEALIGGLVVQAGDLVIDSSVRTKLREMYTSLTTL